MGLAIMGVVQETRLIQIEKVTAYLKKKKKIEKVTQNEIRMNKNNNRDG